MARASTKWCNSRALHNQKQNSSKHTMQSMRSCKTTICKAGKNMPSILSQRQQIFRLNTGWHPRRRNCPQTCPRMHLRSPKFRTLTSGLKMALVNSFSNLDKLVINSSCLSFQVTCLQPSQKATFSARETPRVNWWTRRLSSKLVTCSNSSNLNCSKWLKRAKFRSWI